MKNEILKLISIPFYGDEIRILTNRNGVIGMVRLFEIEPPVEVLNSMIEVTNNVEMTKLEDEMTNQFDHENIDMSDSIEMNKDQLSIKIETDVNKFIAVTPNGVNFNVKEVK